MPERFLKLKDVVLATGVGASTVYRLIEQGRFPQQVKLGGPKASAWLASEVEAWQRQRIEERDSGRAKKTIPAAGRSWRPIRTRGKVQ